MARVEVVMPQMGESIVEGTIVEWIKNVGDAVEVDEDIFTLSTDKVDAEVPSPVKGVLVEVLAAVGDDVAVGEVVAVIETDIEAAKAAPKASAKSGGAAEPEDAPARGKAKKEAPAPAAQTPAPAAAKPAPPAPAAPAPRASASVPPSPGESADELRERRSTPVVRKIAAEHGIDDLSGIPGTGVGGRVTKRDILAWLDQGGAEAPASASMAHSAMPPSAPATSAPAPTGKVAAPPTALPPIPLDNLPDGWDVALVRTPRIHIRDNDRVVPMTRMRASMADNMLQSRRGAAHCHTVWEADVTRIIKIRKKLAPDFEERGAKLTYTAFFLAAVIDGLRQYPILNAAVDGRNIVYRGDMNLGVAVAIEEGLIVPVLKNADTLNLFGLARGISDLAGRANAGTLKPQDVVDGTFTVSNAGIWGALYGVPVLVQPQVGILGIGGIKKRVVADEDDNIRVRSIATMCLSFDHRIIDGATADGFMKFVTERLANWE